MTIEDLSLYLDSDCTDITRYEELIKERDDMRKRVARASIRYYDALDLLNILDDEDKTKESVLNRIAGANRVIARFHQLKSKLSEIDSEIDNLLLA